MKKYDIVSADLNPRKGSTQSGVRPCVIIQNNLFNRKSPTVIVIPLTSVIKTLFPSEFLIQTSKENGLTSPSRFLGSQIMTLDKKYISQTIGKLEEQYYQDVKEALFVSLDIEDDFMSE